MAKAKTLSNEQLSAVLGYIGETSKHPIRDYVIVLLSFKAGLRVGEIAGLQWSDVTDAFGNVGREINGERFFEVPRAIAKKGSGRVIPIHPALFAALTALRGTLPPEITKGRHHVIRGSNRPAIEANALQQYLRRLYIRCGLEGCSSHSGRRSFITQASRVAAHHGCSLRDVQKLAGHRDIATTETYIDLSAGAASLVGAV
jgi:integrase/recombinase XerD